MNPPAQQTTGPIAVYGATGYTGRLVAAELARQGTDFVIAGRNEEKLRRLAAEVGDPPTRAVTLDDRAALRELLAPCAAVISCAGSPFVANGEPVVAAAVDACTHYVDTTGEQPFMQTVFGYARRAQESGIALVPAMGFDYVPGDLIASLTAAGMEPLDEITIAYSVESFGPSRGTTSSAVAMLSGGDLEWRDGALRPASQRVSRGRFRFPPPVGEQLMTRYPSGEQLTVPRHVTARNVRTMLSATAVVGDPRFARLALMTRPLQPLLRSPARRLVDAAVARLPEGPGEEQRRRARFMVVCDARAGELHRRGIVTGSDIYGLTAVTTVEAAVRMAQQGYDRAGALAPAEAFDARGFLDSLSDAGVDYEVEGA